MDIVDARDLWIERKAALYNAISYSSLKPEYKKELIDAIIKFCVDNDTNSWRVFTRDRVNLYQRFLKDRWADLAVWTQEMPEHFNVRVRRPPSGSPPYEIVYASVAEGVRLTHMNMADVYWQPGANPIITFFSSNDEHTDLWSVRHDHPINDVVRKWIQSGDWAEIANHNGGPCGIERYVLVAPE